MAMPLWALTAVYWVHMVATVVWIGGLATLVILVMPAARKTLEPQAFAAFLNSLQKRLDPLGWISLLALGATGLFQMSANPNYSGFLAIDNRWAVAILLKHLVFLVLTGASAYITWGLLPKLQRLALRASTPGGAGRLAEVESLQRQENRLLRLNLVLALVILALTALARVS